MNKPKRLTATDLKLPNLWSIRACVGAKHHPLVTILTRHNKELVRRQARAGNWGWVIDDTGICSKTSAGYLTTTAEGHKWESYDYVMED